MQGIVLRLFTLILFVGLVSWTQPARAETSLSLDNAWGQALRQTRKYHQGLGALERADWSGHDQVSKALQKVRAATGEQERDFYRMDYVLQRALHIRGVAIVLADILDDHRAFQTKLGQHRSSFERITASAQFTGMRNLLDLVMDHELVTKATGDTIEVTRDRLVTMILVNLVSSPGDMTEVFSRRARIFENGLYDNLDSLRQELDYLSGQLQTI